MNEQIQHQLTAAGMSAEQAAVKAGLFQLAIGRLRGRGIDGPLHAFYVPGRIEFLGKHTDYAGGRSLICALDRGFCIVAAGRADNTVRVLGETLDTDLSFELQPQLVPTVGHWSNYPMVVGRRIARNFTGPLVGADIAFASDLPQASGLSSSSAMTIAFFMVLSAVNRLSDRDEYRSNISTPADLAGYLGTIENGQNFGTFVGDRGAGTFGGSEDHTAILTSVPGQLSQYSFCPVRHERQVQLPADHTLVIGISGVIAEKTGATQAAYNNASLLAREVLSIWNKASGRQDATLAAAVEGLGSDAVRQSLVDPKLLNRYDQFVTESMLIVPAAGDVLIAGRLNELGSLVDQSQKLAEKLLKNQVLETIYLAESARECGAVAASSFGAGFGGSVWALVRTADLHSFVAQWRNNYQIRFPNSAPRSYFFTASAGIPMTKLDTI